MDGLRQDFEVLASPAGAGELRVELGLDGATAEAATYGAKLTLAGSGREIATAACTWTMPALSLTARLEVSEAGRLAVCVGMSVRIDPTFSDADWVALNPSIPVPMAVWAP